MDYNKLIEETTSKINNYTFDDEFYNDIYNKAKKRLETAYNESLNTLNTDYKAERRRAVGDNALATKSLQEELAHRGLAHSGESALLSINQSLALRNTVAELARAAIKSRSELSSSYNNELSSLEKEQANLKLAAMEKDKSALNDRLAHLESLQADKEKWSANYALELMKENNRVKEKYEELAREEAEKAESKKEETASGSGFPEVTPTTSPIKVAENIISQFTEDEKERTISGDIYQNQVRRELTRMVCTMGLSKAYTEDLVYALMSRGFDGDFNYDFASSKNLKWAYATYQNTYNKEYAAQMSKGVSAKRAQFEAKSKAKTKMYEFIKSLKLNNNELRAFQENLWF